MTDYRVAVLGLGGIGSAAAFWASRRLGGDVLGVEQFELGHIRGGSEDHSRIIRLSYHTPAYVELAKAAYEAWEQVEVESGEQLVLRTGGLDLAPAGASIGLDDYRMSMTAASVPFEELDAAEVMRRWPQWRLSEDVTALYQERSGIAMASRCQCDTSSAGPRERCDPRGRRRRRRHPGGRRRGRDRGRRQVPSSRLVDRRCRGMDPNRVGSVWEWISRSR